MKILEKLKKNPADAFLALAFTLILFLPVTQGLSQIFPEAELIENRVLAPKPVLGQTHLREYPRKFEAFFNDHFGFRKTLIKAYTYLKVRTLPLPESPNDSVIIGKDGWLLYRAEARGDGNTINDLFGHLRYSEEELQTIKNNIAADAKRLKAMGWFYVLVIVPNKSTIYPEHLPKAMFEQRKDAETRLDQIMNHVGTLPNVEIIDLRELLEKQKRFYQLYKETDTHWNYIGAYFAYEEIMRRLARHFPEFEAHKLSDFKITIKPTDKGGDLAGMMGMQEHFRDEAIFLDLKKGVTTSKTERIVYFFHDSFGEGLIPFLERHIEKFEEVQDGNIRFDALDYLVRNKYKTSYQPAYLLNSGGDGGADQSTNIVILAMVERYQGVLLTRKPFT